LRLFDHYFAHSGLIETCSHHPIVTHYPIELGLLIGKAAIALFDPFA